MKHQATECLYYFGKQILNAKLQHRIVLVLGSRHSEFQSSLEKGSTSNEDDLKRKLFLKFENLVLLDALGSAWLQNSIFEKDHFWLERQFDPASDERNDSRISCYVKESVGDNPADGRNIKTSTESNIQVSLKRKSHGLLLTQCRIYWNLFTNDSQMGIN